jgi:hypothetical protein
VCIDGKGDKQIVEGATLSVEGLVEKEWTELLKVDDFLDEDRRSTRSYSKTLSWLCPRGSL